MFAHIIPGESLKARVDDWQSAGTLMLFNQEEFVVDYDVFVGASMNHSAYVYIPNSCNTANSECRVHIAIHGCHQGLETVKSYYAEQTGYLEWAASNDIIVLFPQADSNYVPFNPKGCWDFWGYTGEDYASNLGVHPSAVRRMVERLMSTPEEVQEVFL